MLNCFDLILALLWIVTIAICCAIAGVVGGFAAAIAEKFLALPFEVCSLCGFVVGLGTFGIILKFTIRIWTAWSLKDRW